MAQHEAGTPAPPITIPEQVKALLISCNVPESKYMSDICDIENACTVMGGMLSQSLISANKARDSLVEAKNKIEDWRTKHERLESKLESVSDDVIRLTVQNQLLMKQRNIFCNSARRLYAHLTRLYHSCVISKQQHQRLLPYLSMPVDDINKLTYDCESIISCDTIPSVAYSQGVDRKSVV